MARSPQSLPHAKNVTQIVLKWLFEPDHRFEVVGLVLVKYGTTTTVFRQTNESLFRDPLRENRLLFGRSIAVRKTGKYQRV